MGLTQYTGVSARPGDTITVYLAGTLNLAALYEDADGLTLLGNSFTSDLCSGEWSFFAVAVPYDVVDRTT